MRGETLKNISFFEYTALIEVKKTLNVSKKKETYSFLNIFDDEAEEVEAEFEEERMDVEEGHDDDEAKMEVEILIEEKTSDRKVGRKKNLQFSFSPFHPLCCRRSFHIEETYK